MGGRGVNSKRIRGPARHGPHGPAGREPIRLDGVELKLTTLSIM